VTRRPLPSIRGNLGPSGLTHKRAQTFGVAWGCGTPYHAGPFGGFLACWAGTVGDCSGTAACFLRRHLALYARLAGAVRLSRPSQGLLDHGQREVKGGKAPLGGGTSFCAGSCSGGSRSSSWLINGLFHRSGDRRWKGDGLITVVRAWRRGPRLAVMLGASSTTGSALATWIRHS